MPERSPKRERWTRAGARALCLHLLWLRRHDDSEEKVAWRRSVWLARTFAILLVLAVVFIGITVYPNHVVIPPHPSVADELFRSRALIFVVRVVAVFAAGYIVASLVARIWGREWLSKAGPFEVQANVVDLTNELEDAFNEIIANEEEIGALNDRLAESARAVDELRVTRDHAISTVESLQHQLDQAEMSIASFRKLINRLGNADG